MRNFKSLLIVSIVIFSLVGNVLAKRKEHIPNSERVPAISIEKAIAIVNQHHETGALSEKKIYIDEAVLLRREGNYYWKVGYRLQAYESGHFYVKVFMDGKIETGPVVKDG